MMTIFDDTARTASHWHSQVGSRVHALVQAKPGETWRMATVVIAGVVILITALVASRSATPVPMSMMDQPIKTQSAHVVLNTKNVNECRVLEYDNRTSTLRPLGLTDCRDKKGQVAIPEEFTGGADPRRLNSIREGFARR